MVEGARLESVYTGNCIKGSNPFVSALSFLFPGIKRFESYDEAMLVAMPTYIVGTFVRNESYFIIVIVTLI